MKSSDFKEIEHFSLPVKIQENENKLPGEQDNAVVKPALSIFHLLPEISPNDVRNDAIDKSIQKADGTDYEQGKNDGETKASQVYQDTIKLLETSLETLSTQYNAIRSQIEVSHLQAVSTCLKAILPEMASRSAEIQIIETIQSLCAVAIKGHIALYVHPSQTGSVKAILDKQSSSNNDFEIIADPDAKPYSFVTKWNGGGVKIDTATVVDQCLNALDQANSSSKQLNGEQ